MWCRFPGVERGSCNKTGSAVKTDVELRFFPLGGGSVPGPGGRHGDRPLRAIGGGLQRCGRQVIVRGGPLWVSERRGGRVLRGGRLQGCVAVLGIALRAASGARHFAPQHLLTQLEILLPLLLLLLLLSSVEFAFRCSPTHLQRFLRAEEPGTAASVSPEILILVVTGLGEMTGVGAAVEIGVFR